MLEERWTEVSPTGAYWMPTRLISDNRLAAFARDESTHAFAEASPATVEVRLLFRRAYIDLARHKGWEVSDIPMAEVELSLP